MSVTLLEAMKYTNDVFGRSYVEEISRDSVLLLNLPPVPPRSRWQRFRDRISHFRGYRVVLKHKDNYCEEDY